MILTPSELKQLNEEAASKGMSVEALVSHLVREHLIKQRSIKVAIEEGRAACN